MKLKNNEDRKQWLRKYRDWGVWYVDENINVTYYKYEFGNGAKLIVDEYFSPKDGPAPAHYYQYYHLVGAPKPPAGKIWPYHTVYERWSDSETYLIEYLKSLGKDADFKIADL